MAFDGDSIHPDSESLTAKLNSIPNAMGNGATSTLIEADIDDSRYTLVPCGHYIELEHQTIALQTKISYPNC